MKDVCIYNFYCRCPFKHGVRLEDVFIGKKIPVKILEEYKGYLLFPIKERKSNQQLLLSPYLREPDMEELDSNIRCGRFSFSDLPEGKIKLHPCFTSVCFLLDVVDVSDNKISISILSEIEKNTSKFIKCVSLLRPSAIAWSLARDEEYVEAIATAYRRKRTNVKQWTQLLLLDPYGEQKSDTLSVEEFWYIYKNLHKEITLQSELLADAYQCFMRSEYRETVLNCATIIEQTLKEQIRKYLDESQTQGNIMNVIMDSVDGYGKIVKTMKKLGIPTANCNEIQKRTIELRNKVIHGGQFPKKGEAEQAISDARLIMEQYNVSLFID